MRKQPFFLALLLAALSVPAWAQTAPSAAARVAPRDPGIASTGLPQHDQARTDRTVDSIDSHLLEAEKDRPRLPNQAPSPSQELPGGVAAGRTPHRQG